MSGPLPSLNGLQMFEAAAFNFARGIDEEVVAVVESGNDALDEGLGLFAGAVAVLDEVGDFERLDEFHQREERAVHEADDERAQDDFAAELGHDEDGIDVAGVIGENEDRAAQFAELVESRHFDAVAKPDERATDVAHEESDHGLV